MLDPNPWFWFALIATVGLYKLELLTSLLNLSRLGTQPPEALRDDLDEDAWEKLREYIGAQSRADILQRSLQLGLFLVFWWAGGFPWVNQYAQTLHPHPILQGLAFIGILWLATSLVSLPFDAWDTFGIEARFGFNKTTVRTFITDRLKGTLLAFIFGAPLLAFILWLFDNVENAAFYGWLTLSSFTLLMSFIAPRLLMPLFFKFEPLKDASLQQAVIDLAKRLKFPVAEVSVVDGSRRSSKANAFFTGMGKTRRIALFDTLVDSHPREEILAVLAHEIGHWQRGHVPKQLALSILTNAILFALLHFAIHSETLSAAFGIAPATTAVNFVLFFIVVTPITELIGVFGSWISRKNEFEADAYARDAMQDSAPLASALHRLNRDHMNHPTPHPLHIILHHSHPPVLERLAALRGNS
ncbi:M48 family metallopeptidase [Phragmitibacter flavus]|uniref:M48 family metallopeptidase n=1 Tax=Phragmitibacter flavus TaxID=2576071 RepID=A0A5R8K9C6_9BACT|nr:M48 family metallopeptidase [Phragmitibacter flavus]TLD68914.1 M48 family metallopeptidase [Phragmitibacter flavus]